MQPGRTFHGHSERQLSGASGRLRQHIYEQETYLAEVYPLLGAPAPYTPRKSLVDSANRVINVGAAVALVSLVCFVVGCFQAIDASLRASPLPLTAPAAAKPHCRSG